MTYLFTCQHTAFFMVNVVANGVINRQNKVTNVSWLRSTSEAFSSGRSTSAAGKSLRNTAQSVVSLSHTRNVNNKLDNKLNLIKPLAFYIK